jgi:hypothetical protein
MPEHNAELARAINEVLAWMGANAESAGAALGINSRTLTAMGQGIVPMRSLMIRFADGVRQRCERETDVPDWWRDVDAWLRVAGYPPRRDGTEGERAAYARPPAAQAPPRQVPPPPRPASAPEDETPAVKYYRPVYERQPWGDSILHVFWLLDPQNRKIFQRSMPADWDYKAEAARWKQDLGRLTKSQFDRKYGRFRYNGG